MSKGKTVTLNSVELHVVEKALDAYKRDVLLLVEDKGIKRDMVDTANGILTKVKANKTS